MSQFSLFQNPPKPHHSRRKINLQRSVCSGKIHPYYGKGFDIFVIRLETHLSQLSDFNIDCNVSITIKPQHQKVLSEVILTSDQDMYEISNILTCARLIATELAFGFEGRYDVNITYSQKLL